MITEDDIKDFHPFEVRVTPWKKIRDDSEPSMCRIWQARQGKYWYQRHEWKYSDGRTYLEPIIDSIKGWSKNARSPSE